MYLLKVIKRISLILGLFALSITIIASQGYEPHGSCFQQKHLSLKEAISLALRNNPQIRSAELQRIIDKFTLEVARNQFLPQYDFHTSATYSNGAKPFYTTNPKINYQTPIGTQFGLGLNDQVNAGRETAAFVEVTQPLLRGFGPRIVGANYKTALDQELINLLNFKETLINTVIDVMAAYYKLVQDHNNIKIGELALDNSLKILKGTELRIKAGKLAPMESVQQQAQIANLRITLTRDKNALSQDYRALLILLGLDPRSNLSIDTDIVIPAKYLPSNEEAINTSLCHNIDYQRSLIQLRQLELALLVAQNEQKWQLDLVGRAQEQIIRNKNFTPVNIDQLDAIGNDPRKSNQSLVLNLSIPLNDLSRKQTLVRAKIALQQYRIQLDTLKKQLIAQVLNSLENLRTQCSQLELAKEAVNFAQQSLDVAQKKFLYGRTNMFEITSLQKSFKEQQLSLISEQISFLNNEASFEKLLGRALEKWCIKFYDPN